LHETCAGISFLYWAVKRRKLCILRVENDEDHSETICIFSDRCGVLLKHFDD
jgi:hypothetical protein